PQKWAQWSRASDTVEVTRSSLVDVRRQVALAVARSYLAVITEKRLLDTSERARDTAKAHYEFAHSRLQAGLGNRLDEVRAGQEVATDEAQVEVILGALTREKEAVGVLAGIEHPVDVVDEPTFDVIPTMESAMEEIKTRSDVKAAERRLYAAERSSKQDWT